LLAHSGTFFGHSRGTNLAKFAGHFSKNFWPLAIFAQRLLRAALGACAAPFRWGKLDASCGAAGETIKTLENQP
jgi:hypothetical protein